MSQEKEKETRAKGINFIRQVGIMLKLPEITLSTAAIFFNRYLMRMSLVDRPDQKALHHYVRFVGQARVPKSEGADVDRRWAQHVFSLPRRSRSVAAR